MKKQKIILIFYAKFNPPTNFHILLIKKIIKKINPNKIFIAIDRNKTKVDHEIFPPFSYHKQMIKNLIVENKINCNLFDFFENFNINNVNKYKNNKIYFLIDTEKIKLLQKNKKITKIKQFVNFICYHSKKNETKNFIYFDKKVLGKTNIDYIKNNHLYLEHVIKNKLPLSRYLHTLRVLDTATKIGYGNNFNDKEILQVQIAAILHDIGKTYSDEQIRKILSNNQLKWFPTIHCAHGLIGAKIAKNQYSISDKTILVAIANHVICKDDSKVTKALFCADKLEPARTKKDIPHRLQLYHKCINNGLNKIFQKVITLNKEKY